ncbi:MAG TPA: type III-A CRISPR-associated RAMP protein Csm3 [Tissierellaceae bacterium]
MRLLGKIFIDGKIKALTGLTIGGSKTDTIIGGIDNSVVKTSEGVPYIPGSSLKGKMRSLLELKEDKNICRCGKCNICAIFGVMANSRKENLDGKEIPISNTQRVMANSRKENLGPTRLADSRKENLGPTRLIVRDAHLNEKVKEQMKNKEGIFNELELVYTESKWENVVDRITSQAKYPRQTERVPAGAIFDFSMVFNVFEEKDIKRFYLLLSVMAMLEDDYLGGNGTRGYGRIKFIDFDVKAKSVDDYENNNVPLILGEKIADLSALMNDKEIKSKLSKHLLGVE